jgi:hypothetical protein
VAYDFSAPDSGYIGGFNGKGQYTIDSFGRSKGINRIVGKGSFEAEFAVTNMKFNPIKPGAGKGESPGPRILFKDARTRSLSLRFDIDHIALDIKDGETDSPIRFDRNLGVKYSTPPSSAKAKTKNNGVYFTALTGMIQRSSCRRARLEYTSAKLSAILLLAIL